MRRRVQRSSGAHLLFCDQTTIGATGAAQSATVACAFRAIFGIALDILIFVNKSSGHYLHSANARRKHEMRRELESRAGDFDEG